MASSKRGTRTPNPLRREYRDAIAECTHILNGVYRRIALTEEGTDERQSALRYIRTLERKASELLAKADYLREQIGEAEDNRDKLVLRRNQLLIFRDLLERFGKRKTEHSVKEIETLSKQMALSIRNK